MYINDEHHVDLDTWKNMVFISDEFFASNGCILDSKPNNIFITKKLGSKTIFLNPTKSFDTKQIDISLSCPNFGGQFMCELTDEDGVKIQADVKYQKDPKDSNIYKICIEIPKTGSWVLKIYGSLLSSNCNNEDTAITKIIYEFLLKFCINIIFN